LSGVSAQAADAVMVRRSPDYDAQEKVRVLPFPRSERAQSVWESGTCWSTCGSVSAWGLPACIEWSPQGECLAWANRADRTCQSRCRTSGGPLLNPLMPLIDW